MIYYTSAEMPFSFQDFIDEEVRDRGNYTQDQINDWIKKYNLELSDLMIWVSPDKYIANRYNYPAEMWDELAEDPTKVELNVREIDDTEGVIIEESDDGDNGYLFVFRKVRSAYAYRKLAQERVRYLKTKEKDPLKFPSLKTREYPEDLVFDFVPEPEQPKTRNEKFKTQIMKELVEKQWKDGLSYYDVYRGIGQDFSQGISQHQIFPQGRQGKKTEGYKI